MNFKVSKHAAYAHVTIEGRIEAHHLDIVREAVKSLIDKQFRNLVIDFTSSAPDFLPEAFSCVAQLLMVCRLNEGVCVAIAPGPGLIDMLARTGLEFFVNVVGNKDRALPCLLARMRKRYGHEFFEMLLERSYLTREQLQEVADIYYDSDEKKPFGDILLEKKYLAIDTLLFLLATSMYESTGQDKKEGRTISNGRTASSIHSTGSVRAPVHRVDDMSTIKPQESEFFKRSLFGEILVEQGYITPDQLSVSLEIQQKEEDKKLGDILIEQHFIAENQVFDVLQSQIRRRRELSKETVDLRLIQRKKKARSHRSEFVTNSLFGEILLELEFVTEDQLRQALEIQKKDPQERQLGEILIELNVVTPAQVLRVLEEQTDRKG